MPYRFLDYLCVDCGHKFEVLSHLPEEDIELRVCPECGGAAEKHFMLGKASTPKLIVRGNSDFSDRERERLTKRSDEHWKREGRDEAVDRQRMQWKREGIVRW